MNYYSLLFIFKIQIIMFTPRYMRILRRHYPMYSVDEIEAALILCMLSEKKNLY